MSLKSLSITFKLKGIILLTAFTVLLFNTIIYLSDEVVSGRNTLEENLYSIATILASNSTAAIHFQDPDSATQLLSTLRTQPNIEAALIRTTDHVTFARYISARPTITLDALQIPPRIRVELSRPAALAAPKVWGAGRHIHLLQQILFEDGSILGSIHLVSNTEQLDRRFTDYLINSTLLLVLSLMIAFALSSRLQRVISRPILELLSTMDAVAGKQDYSLRAHREGDDELGMLIDSFNEMLSQIETRDDQIRDHRNELEQLVAQRTGELAASIARFSTVLNSLDAIVYVADIRSHELLFINQAGRDLIGEREGDRCWEVVRGLEDGPCSNCTNRLLVDADGRPSGIHAWEYRNPQNGHWYAIRDRAIAWDEGKVVRLEIATDITNLKQIQIDLETAKDKAEGANQAKSKFLSSMSHEIRTPMNGIIGFTELLQKTALDDTQQNYLRTITISARNLLTIIDDILDFSKLESERLVLEKIPFNLHDLVEEVLLLLAPQAYNRGLELIRLISPRLPPELLGDPVRIRQILINLLGNAIKFTEEGQVSLEFELSQERDGRVAVAIAVRDTGIGITREQQKRLFKAFSQADDSITRRFGGTGLGLMIVKHLVTLMDGQMRVESQPGKGTAFLFTLWLERGAIITQRHPLAGRRILVYESNPALLRQFTSEVERWGGRPEPISDLTCEQSDLFKLRWDLFLCGLTREEASEEEFAALMQRLPERHRIPLVALVNYSDPETLNRLRSQGAAFSAPKVEPASTLMREIDRLLRGETSSRQVAKADESSQPHFKGVRVLAVDDNPINLTLATTLLRQSGATVFEASGGRQAIQIATKQPLDLILMDVQMPEMSGVEATRLLREQGGGSSNPPIIALTAHAFFDQRTEFFDAGMNDVLTKPFTADKLYSIMDRWVTKGGESSSVQAVTRSSTIAADEGNPQPDKSIAQFNKPLIVADSEWGRSEELPVFDAAHAEELAGDDEILTHALLAQFNGSLLETRSSFAAAVSDGSIDEIRRLSHRLRGSASTCSLLALSESAGNLEEAIGPEDVPNPTLAQLRPLIDRLEHELDRVERYLDQQSATNIAKSG